MASKVPSLTRFRAADATGTPSVLRAVLDLIAIDSLHPEPVTSEYRADRQRPQRNTQLFSKQTPLRLSSSATVTPRSCVIAGLAGSPRGGRPQSHRSGAATIGGDDTARGGGHAAIDLFMVVRGAGDGGARSRRCTIAGAG